MIPKCLTACHFPIWVASKSIINSGAYVSFHSKSLCSGIWIVEIEDGVCVCVCVCVCVSTGEGKGLMMHGYNVLKLIKLRGAWVGGQGCDSSHCIQGADTGRVT